MPAVGFYYWLQALLTLHWPLSPDVLCDRLTWPRKKHNRSWSESILFCIMQSVLHLSATVAAAVFWHRWGHSVCACVRARAYSSVRFRHIQWIIQISESSCHGCLWNVADWLCYWPLFVFKMHLTLKSLFCLFKLRFLSSGAIHLAKPVGESVHCKNVQ